MRHKADGDAVDISDFAEEFATVGHDLAPDDIVLVRTGRDRFYGSPDYMHRGPWVTPEATRWLFERGVRVMGIERLGLGSTSTRCRQTRPAQLPPPESSGPRTRSASRTARSNAFTGWASPRRAASPSRASPEGGARQRRPGAGRGHLRRRPPKTFEPRRFARRARATGRDGTWHLLVSRVTCCRPGRAREASGAGACAVQLKVDVPTHVEAALSSGASCPRRPYWQCSEVRALLPSRR